MNLDDVTGARLAPLLLPAAAPDGREALYPALLVEPLALAYLSHDAEPGPAVRLTGGAMTRLVEAPSLKAPAVPLYVSAAALRAAAAERRYWPDGIERAAVFEMGAAFQLLAGHPGALLVGEAGVTVALDAGEVAALAAGQSPTAYLDALRALVQRGKGREAAARLARRSLYVLGHPQGGLMLVDREVAAFLHLSTAERFATRLREQTGDGGQHGVVLGAELFQHALRGKLQVLVEPGPRSFRLRPADLR